jgi:hypothetical protein
VGRLLPLLLLLAGVAPADEASLLSLDDRILVSAAFGDADNDGDEDLDVTSTRGGNVFPRNDGSGRFTDATKEAGLAWVGHSHGATFLDADGDGDGRLDLAVNNFNDRAFLYMNRSPKRDSIAFRLAGARVRDATGAVVRISAAGRVRVGQVQSAGGYLAQSSRAVHFGLGDAETVEWAEIQGPRAADRRPRGEQPHRIAAPRE